MLQGNVNAAIHLLSQDVNGGVLSLDDLIPTGIKQNGETVQQTARDVLLENHPQGQLAPDNTRLNSSSTNHGHDHITFDQITGEAVRKTALYTHGAGGPSGIDAYAWRHFFSSFQGASTDLCNALAAVAKQLCTVNVHPDAGFSLKRGTAAPRHSVKPANKVGAIIYKEPATYKRAVVRPYDRICITFYHN